MWLVALEFKPSRVAASANTPTTRVLQDNHGVSRSGFLKCGIQFMRHKGDDIQPTSLATLFKSLQCVECAGWNPPEQWE